MNRKSLFVAVAFAASVVIGRAQAVDLLGEWNLVITAQGTIETKLVIAAEGDRLTARLVAAGGETLPATVRQTGNDVLIEFDLKDTPTQPLHVTLTGTAANERMSGSVDFGGQGTAKWTAVRANQGQR